MTLSGVAIAGFWAASAVKVAGMTWDAFTSTYSRFPDSSNQPSNFSGSPAKASAAIGLPNLTKGKTAVTTTAGLAASPITPGTANAGIGRVLKWLGGLF